MQEPGGPDAIIGRIRREFVIGGHKAAAVAMTMKQATVCLVSALPADSMRCIGFVPFSTLADAVYYARAQFNSPRVAVMPEGGSVVPCVVCDHQREVTQ
jgi:nickel-dependent lactate racemase